MVMINVISEVNWQFSPQVGRPRQRGGREGGGIKRAFPPVKPSRLGNCPMPLWMSVQDAPIPIASPWLSLLEPRWHLNKGAVRLTDK